MSWLSILLSAMLVFWALGAYNRLVRLRSEVVRSLQALALLWQAQAQAIGLRLEKFAQGSETESQWATLDEDALRWRPLALATRQFLASLSVMQNKPHLLPKREDVAAAKAARAIFESHWHQLRSEQEDLAGTPVPPDLQQLMAQHEPLIQERLREYMRAVNQYHHAIGQFPALLLAGVFGFVKAGELT